MRRSLVRNLFPPPPFPPTVYVDVSRPPPPPTSLAALEAKPMLKATCLIRLARRDTSFLTCGGTRCSSTAPLASSSTKALVVMSCSVNGMPLESCNVDAWSVALCAGIHLTRSTAELSSKYGKTMFQSLAFILPWCVARLTPPRKVINTERQSVVAVVPMNSATRTAMSSAHASTIGTDWIQRGGSPLAAATTSSVPGRTTANAHPDLPTLCPSSLDASE